MANLRLFVEDLLRSELSVARKKLDNFVLENVSQLSDEAWLSLSNDVIACVVESASSCKVEFTSEDRYWSDFSISLLEKDREEFGELSLSNEETVYQLLGVMGKCYVFGVYHGSVVKLPRRVTLKLLKSHFGKSCEFFIKKGLSPLVVEIHLPKLFNKKLSPILNTESHLKIAEFVNRNKSVKGVFNANWYYDPHVGKISPNLNYLSEFASTNGAMLVKMSSDKSAIGDATTKSKTRKEKYDRGEYLPMRYARLWPSEKILKWAENFKLELVLPR